ncbi:unnamed protein product, partial [Phaeothamnion confervicola]
MTLARHPATDFNAIGAAKRRLALPPEPSGMDDLKAEMKLLRWHKLANEAALKAAIVKTRRVKADAAAAASAGTPHSQVARSAVIDDEQSKPLHVSREFVQAHERREQIATERLDREVEAHLASLQRLRAQIQQRHAEQERLAHFKAKQCSLEKDRAMLLQGRLSPARSSASLRRCSDGTAGQRHKEKEPAAASAGRRGHCSGSDDAGGATAKVLTSLDRLVELEQRISRLENGGNAYD